MKSPRWIARIVAFLGGYFWLPCPLCDRMFGGQESTAASIPTEDPSIRMVVCPWCRNRPGTQL